MGCAVALTAIAWVTTSPPAAAFVLSEDELEEQSTELGVVVRSFQFLFAGEVLERPFNLQDESPAGSSTLDLRMYFSHQTSDFELTLHNSLQSQFRTHQALGLLPLGRSLTPPRFLPLRVTAAEDPTIDVVSDVDWLYVSQRIGTVTATLGRQPVSFGRGRIWRTYDLVSTFALTEVDTEYKPGADALSLEWSPTSRTTATAVVAIGEPEQDDDFEASSRGATALAQLKQGLPNSELGVVAGFVRRDLMFGWDGFWDLGSLDVYGELTATWVRDGSPSSPAVAERDVPVLRAVAGATLRPVSKLTLSPELYYNGFGAARPEDYIPVALSERVGLGEQTALGKLYAGAASDWEIHPLVHIMTLAVSNLRDPSALASVAVSHNLADNAQLIAGGFAPFGEKPKVEGFFPQPQSEFGLYPYFVYAELKLVL